MRARVLCSVLFLHWLSAVEGATDPENGIEDRVEVRPEPSRLVAYSKDTDELNQMLAPDGPLDWLLLLGRNRVAIGSAELLHPRLSIKSVHMHFDRPESPLTVALLDSTGHGMTPMLNTQPGEPEQLLAKLRERQALGKVLVEVCAEEDGQFGRLVLTSLWAEQPDALSELLLLNGTEPNVPDLLHPQSLPVAVCGFRHQHRDRYLLVALRSLHQVQVAKVQVLLDRPLAQCLEEDRRLAERDFVAQRFRIHSNGTHAKCAAIYWFSPGSRHLLTVAGSAPGALAEHYAQLRNRTGRRHSLFSPKSFSSALNQSVLLWSSVPLWPFPAGRPLLPADRPLPFRYLPGVNLELPAQLLAFLNNRVVGFMQRFRMPGLSLAVVQDEQLKLAAAYGYADAVQQSPLTPWDRLRVGSVSKTITAAAVFQLIDEGTLGLDELVFGPDGVLGMDMTAEDSYPPFVDQITVRHLLSHTVGAWGNEAPDPVFASSARSASELIRQVIRERPLTEPPGLHFLYSNLGYAVLGKVLEYRSGMPYAEYVNRRLFAPIGLSRQHTIGGKFKAPSEGDVLYYMTPESPDDPYELPAPALLEACCGWVLAPQDLLRFSTHVDGFPARPDLISAAAFLQMGRMTRASNYSYGMGWWLNERGFNGRSHQGQMPSALTLLVRADSGAQLVISTNRYEPSVDAEVAYLAHHVLALFASAAGQGAAEAGGAAEAAADHFLDPPPASAADLRW